MQGAETLNIHCKKGKCALTISALSKKKTVTFQFLGLTCLICVGVVAKVADIQAHKPADLLLLKLLCDAAVQWYSTGGTWA